MGIRFQEIMFPHFYPPHSYQSFTMTYMLLKWIKFNNQKLIFTIDNLGYQKRKKKLKDFLELFFTNNIYIKQT
jgi:hypothetical protein